MNALLDSARRADEKRTRAAVGIRDRWSNLPRTWRVGAITAFLVFLYALPGLDIPLITTPDTDFTSVLFLCAVYVLVAVGLNVVIGLAGLLDLGYIGFYAVGAYTMAIL